MQHTWNIGTPIESMVGCDCCMVSAPAETVTSSTSTSTSKFPCYQRHAARPDLPPHSPTYSHSAHPLTLHCRCSSKLPLLLSPGVQQGSWCGLRVCQPQGGAVRQGEVFWIDDSSTASMRQSCSRCSRSARLKGRLRTTHAARVPVPAVYSSSSLAHSPTCRAVPCCAMLLLLIQVVPYLIPSGQEGGGKVKTSTAGQLVISPSGRYVAVIDRHSCFVWAAGASATGSRAKPLNLPHTKPYTVSSSSTSSRWVRL